MLKIEYIWRELLYQAIEKSNPVFTITALARQFNLSTSVVAYALYPLKELGIVRVGKFQSSLNDLERLLFFWATRRSLKKDIIYQTYSNLPVSEREALMTAEVYPTAYSAYHLYYDNVPADYENIYFYSPDQISIQKRFPERPKKPVNLTILKQDPFLNKYKKTPLAQIFVDLWNLPEWYAKEFSNGILSMIKSKVGL